MILSPRTLLAVLVSGTLIADASLAQEIDVSSPPYNADMTGAIDGTAALNSAIAAAIATGGPRAVYIPAGTLKITSTITPASAVRLVGAGQSGNNTPATTIKWGGASGATMIQFVGMNLAAHGISNLMLDGNSLAGTCLVIDGSIGGHYQNLRVSGFTVDAGITLTATAPGGSCSSNQLTNIHIDSLLGAKSALWLTGDATNGGSSSHNELHNLTISISGASDGIWLNGNNNDRFYSTLIYDADGSTGAGVRCTAKDLGLGAYGPTDNAFYFLEASRRGWVNDPGLATLPATVYGYQLSHGQPLPVWNGVVFPVIYGNGTAQFITLNASSASFSGALTASTFTGNGAALTGFTASQVPPLDFSKIATGIVPKAQLPAATTYTDVTNTFTRPNHFDVTTARSLTLTKLADPSAPTVTRVGLAGVSTWSYKIVAKLSDGTTTTAASPAGTLSLGFPILNAINYNAIAWSPVAGATYYDVYRTATGTSPSTTGRIASDLTATSYNDQGAVGDGSTPPSANETGTVNGGSYADLSEKPSVPVEQFGASPTATGAANRVAIQAAIDSFLGTSGGGRITFNSGEGKTYKIDGTIYVHGHVTLDGGNMGTILAQESVSAPATIQLGDHISAVYCRLTGLRLLPTVDRAPNTYEIFLNHAQNTAVDNVSFGDEDPGSPSGVWGCLKVGHAGTNTNSIGWFTNIRARGYHQFAYLCRFQDGWFSNISTCASRADSVDLILDGRATANAFNNIDFTCGGVANLILREQDHIGEPNVPTDPNAPSFNKFTNVYFDGATDGVVGSAGDTNSFENCWFSNRPGSGVVLTGTIKNTRFTNCEAFHCDTHGFLISGGTNTVLTGVAARLNVGNGISVSDNYTGGLTVTGGSLDGNQSNLFIGLNVSKVTVNGTRFASSTVRDITTGSPNSETIAILNPQLSFGTPLSIGAYPAQTTAAGVYAGLISNIPSWLLADGIASHNWITENNAGILRWLRAGVPSMTLSGTQLAVNGVIRGQMASGSGDVFIIGNDSKLVDIDVANSAGLYGETDPTVGHLKLGSGGPYLSGVAGTFTVGGNASVTGSLAIGGGAAISKVLSTTATVDFPNTSGLSSTEVDVILTGVGSNDDLIVSPSAYDLGIVGIRYSTANTVKVRFLNTTSGARNPVAGTFRVTAFQHP